MDLPPVLSIVFLVIVIHRSDAVCLSTGMPGILLPFVNGSDGRVRCQSGFYCPNLNASNATTFPDYCQPVLECYEKRQTGDYDCKPQGTFEPLIIPRGYYSEDGISINICPDGYYCRIGSSAPVECPALTACPEGSKRFNFYGGLVVLLMMYIILGAIVVVYRKKFAFSTLLLEAPEVEETEMSESGLQGSGQMLAVPLLLDMSTNSTNTSTGGSDGGVQSPKNRSKRVQLLCDGFRRRRGELKPLNFRFENLQVTVPDATGDKSKTILQGVSGHFKAGKVTAIMGPSGAGKTTLMNSILGKLGPNVKQSGELLINGRNDLLKKLRHSIGFVPQDDILHQELSSYKNMYYSSEIRLPRSWSSTERNLFRSAAIDILGLTERRDVPVGDEIQRGISGGQRKRASIGLELAAAPLAMFLDEPTSGLDSFASMELCLLLREIALQTHLCVAMVIHQPRVEIWNSLDDVLLLAPGGYTVYEGPQNEAQRYFSGTCGVTFDPSANPCDVIMDAIVDRAPELIEKWKGTQQMMEVLMGPRSSTSGAKKEPSSGSNDEVSWDGAPLYRQIWLSHCRAVEKQLMVMQPFYTEMLVAVLCGLILGQSLLDFEHTGEYKDPYKPFTVQPLNFILPQMNLYSLMSLSLAGATAGVRVLGEPLRNFYRETAAGHSRLGFFLGSIWAGLYRVVYSVMGFAAFYHLLPGFSFSFGTFFYTYLGGYFCMYAMAAPISIVASSTSAPLIASIGGITAGIFSGFVEYPVWLKQLSFGYYVAQNMHRLFDKQIEGAMDSTYQLWGYEDMPYGVSFLICIVWGVVVYGIAFVLLCRYKR